MIRVPASVDGPPFRLNPTVSGLAIYLDNWALIDLAEGDPSRRNVLLQRCSPVLRMLKRLPKDGPVFEATNRRKEWHKACAAGLGTLTTVEGKPDPRYNGLDYP